MKQIVIFLVITLISAATAQNCSYDSLEGKYLGGCFDNCMDFADLDSAIKYCNQFADCGGITYARRGNGGSMSMGLAYDEWGYQLRKASDQVTSKNGETSWKKNNCDGIKPVFGDCDFIPAYGQYLSGCFFDCRVFESRQIAISACKKDIACRGITLQRKDGIWGFQLRASGFPEKSKYGESSWVKPINKMCDLK